MDAQQENEISKLRYAMFSKKEEFYSSHKEPVLYAYIYETNSTERE